SRRRRPRSPGGDHSGDGGSRPRQPRQRGRAPRCPPESRQGADVRLHRLPGEDPARRASRDRPRPRGPRADRVPRVGARARRDAPAGSRPGSQGLDHPARPGARRHALDPRLRPRLLLHRGARGEDHGLARRPCGRGGRVRQGHDRRRVGPPAVDRDRPADGGTLGNEREGRPGRHPPGRRAAHAVSGHERALSRDAVADRRGGASDRRGGTCGGHATAHGASRPARQPRPCTPRGRDPRRARGLCSRRRPDAHGRTRSRGRVGPGVSFFGARRHPGVTPLPVEGRMPGFGSAAGWLNSEPLTADDLNGKVVLADFWTYTCINWLRTLAWGRGGEEKYRAQGLVILGVHTPEFWFEHDPDNVSWAAQEMGVEYPVALDPDYGVWSDFGNRYWPAVYLADAEGRIRYHHFGEGDYDEA